MFLLDNRDLKVQCFMSLFQDCQLRSHDYVTKMVVRLSFYIFQHIKIKLNDMSRFKKIICSFFNVFTKKEEKTASKIVEIDQNTILTIMEKLSDFEHKKGYLKPVSLHFLATKIGTNPTYLSKIINTHYEKNFSSYINDLRINYLLKELKTNHSLKTNTVKALARKLGFHSTEVFTKTFKKHTGMNPSNYLNALKS